jgi:hypothetical protein
MVHRCMIKIGCDVAAYISSVLVDVCMLHCRTVCIRWRIKNFDNIKMHGTNVKIILCGATVYRKVTRH